MMFGRGVTTPAPKGWSTPETAERLASLARSKGWYVEADWHTERGIVFVMTLGRLLKEGENKTAKGDRWLYKMVWVETPPENRLTKHHSKMRIEVSRCFTPTTGCWQNAPSVRRIEETIKNNPA